MRHLHIVALTLLTVATGCSSTPSTDPADYPELRGMNQEIAREVLILESKEENFGEPRWRQLGVKSFELCRTAYNVYDVWLNTGEIIEMAEISLPDNPIESADKVILEEIEEFEKAISSGDITALRDLLASPGRCGTMVPLTPGDALFENTIADAINQP